MSRRLTEEAEKYFEDFISNVEDTDISSLDGERSDTSSTLGGMAKIETFHSPVPVISKPLPVDMDGIVLPWLQWETTDDASPQTCKSNKTPQPKTTPISNFVNASQVISTDCPFCQIRNFIILVFLTHFLILLMLQESTTAHDSVCHSNSSRGSWTPASPYVCPLKFGDDGGGSRFEEPESCQAQYEANGTSGLRVDMDDYLDGLRDEEFLFERYMQQQRISSGSILLCNQLFF